MRGLENKCVIIAPLIKLNGIRNISQFAIAFDLRVILISFTIIGSGFIDTSVIAETESENSSDVFSKPMRVDAQEEKEANQLQPLFSPNNSTEFRENNPRKIGDIIEVNPRSEQWEAIHSGDLSTGTIKFKLNR